MHADGALGAALPRGLVKGPLAIILTKPFCHLFSVEFKAYMVNTYNGDDEAEDAGGVTGEDMITVSGGLNGSNHKGDGPWEFHREEG